MSLTRTISDLKTLPTPALLLLVFGLTLFGVLTVTFITAILIGAFIIGFGPGAVAPEQPEISIQSEQSETTDNARINHVEHATAPSVFFSASVLQLSCYSIDTR